MPRLAIRYREFYDVPRIFLVEFGGEFYLFNSSFDDGLDDYRPDYEVHRIPAPAPGELDGTWDGLLERSTERVGVIPVSKVKFDRSRRKWIEDAALADILGLAK